MRVATVVDSVAPGFAESRVTVAVISGEDELGFRCRVVQA